MPVAESQAGCPLLAATLAATMGITEIHQNQVRRGFIPGILRRRRAAHGRRAAQAFGQEDDISVVSVPRTAVAELAVPQGSRVAAAMP